jgi:serine/threonine protein phosphatase PrpC/ribosomal protein L40E
MHTRNCPRCNYENVPQATRCYRCNRNLDDQPVVNGLYGTGELIEGALQFIRERGHNILEPSRVERLREARTKLLPENLNGEPLTCLNCGAYNQPDAAHCATCGAELLTPDQDFGLTVRVSARTSVGQVRSNNEDNVAIWALDGVLVALIADGMGGAAAGEEASRLTVEAVQASFLGETRDSARLQFMSEDELGDRLRQAIREANQSVVERSQRDSSRKGMGTTSTLALIRGNRVMIAHVGDSRAYLIDPKDRGITQVTVDHSFVQALVASGHITQEQARHHPMGHVLYRALGQSLDLDIDMYTRTLRVGDRFIVCSDGLTRHITPEEIAGIVTKTNNPAEATLDLVELTNARGAEDNVSVVVILVDQA